MVVLVAVVLLIVGIAGGTPSSPSSDAGRAGYSTSATDPAKGTVASSQLDPVAADISKQQAQLKEVPGNWTAWAGLAADYVQEGRITADPTYYPKADGALAQSFKIYPNSNFLALTVEATVKAARHDFAGALELADESLKIDPYNSTTYGVRGDALDELGRYSEALASFTRMDRLRPSLSSFSRLSYAFELRGNIPKANKDLQLGLNDSGSASDSAFAAYYLGELSWNYGNDLAAAEKYYRQGVALDPDYVPPLEGLAKVEAAQGKIDDAIRDYEAVVNRLPLPQYVIEYGDYLTSLGRTKEAKAQYQLVLDEEKIFQAQGVNVDLELSLFQADHGDHSGGMKSASAEYARRHSTLVEDAYGWALHVNGRDKEALAHATASLRIGTKSALFHFHRGVIESDLGMKTAAIADLRQALKFNEHFSPLEAPQAKRLLQHLSS